MRAHLKFCENSMCSTTVPDKTGHGWNAALLNGAIAENALLLLNGSSQFLEFPSGLLSNMSEYTIMCWIYVSAQYNFTPVWEFGDDDGNYIFLAINGSILTFGISINFELNYSLTFGDAIGSNRWMHTAIIFKYPILETYTNWTLIKKAPLPAIPSSLSNSPRNWIGRSESENNSYFTGRIADFRIYERAIKADEFVEISNGL